MGAVRWLGIQLKKGGGIFSERLAGGLRYFIQLRNVGPPLDPRFSEAGITAEGGGLPAVYGGHHPSVTG